LTSGNADRADDLVQETVLKALRAQDQFTPGTNMKAWLFTILRNVQISSLRRSYVRSEVGDERLEATHGLPPGQEARLEMRAFAQALAALSPAHREVLVLVGVHGFSYDKVADICGVEVGTIKSRVSRARRELKRLLLDGELPVHPTTVDAERVRQAIDWSSFADAPFTTSDGRKSVPALLN
jgi:RNA polymerase sigma-70 factor (ECF subfamily)